MPAERMRLHRDAGVALAALYAAEPDEHLGELAHHYGVASPDVACEAVDYATRAAGRATAALAHEEAVRLRAMAVRAHQAQPRAGGRERCELLLALGEAQASAGDMVAAKEAFLRAAAVARRLSMGRALARAALGHGGTLVTLPGDDGRIVPLLEEALAALGDDDDALRARVLARLACARPDAGRSRDAVAVARRSGDPAALGWALQARVLFVWGPEALDELLELSGEIIALATRGDEWEQAMNGRLLRFDVHLILGRIAEARADLAAASVLADELWLPRARWHVGVHEVELALLEGRAAEDTIEAARRHGARAATAEVSITAVVQRFPVLLEQGRLGEIRPALETIAAESPGTAVHWCILARLDCETGDDRSARERLELLARDGWAGVTGQLEWLLSMALLAETAAFLRARRCAAELYDLLLPHAGLVVVAPHFFPMGGLVRYLGLLAAVTARLDEAAARLDHAAAQNAAVGARPWVAHANADHARVLLERDGPGDRAHAHELLRDAIGLYRALGMTTSAERAARVLETAGAATT